METPAEPRKEHEEAKDVGDTVSPADLEQAEPFDKPSEPVTGEAGRREQLPEDPDDARERASSDDPE